MVTPTCIQSTFERWLDADPERARHADLPYRLSLVRAPGGRWDDFIRLAPNRDLPAMVRDALPAEHALSDAALASFSHAHQYAAMFGIVTDRIVDGQCADRELLAIRRSFLAGWLDSLAEGLGDRGAARRVVGRAMRAWKRGIDGERALLGAQHDWDRWATSVMARLQWVSASASAMLRAAGAEVAADQLERVYDRLMLALQVLDDRADAAEDVRDRGSAFGVAGVHDDPRTLPGLLLLHAVKAADAGGLRALRAWLRDFALMLLQPPARPACPSTISI